MRQDYYEKLGARLGTLKCMRVYEQGIVLENTGHWWHRRERAIGYGEIRRVWLETFRTGDERDGHTSARIDLIAQNLDVLYTLTLHDRLPDDADLQLMQQVHDRWRKATWRHYHVVAAVVEHEGRYLCMQKGETRYAYTSYHWEFPGGKIEEGETQTQALQRELMEEMEYDVKPVRHLITVEHRYPEFGITLECWLCSAESTDFVRREHADHRWLTLDEMRTLEWCAADAPVVEKLGCEEESERKRVERFIRE